LLRVTIPRIYEATARSDVGQRNSSEIPFTATEVSSVAARRCCNPEQK
jgi:hypothetical protein